MLSDAEADTGVFVLSVLACSDDCSLLSRAASKGTFIASIYRSILICRPEEGCLLLKPPTKHSPHRFPPESPWARSGSKRRRCQSSVHNTDGFVHCVKVKFPLLCRLDLMI